MMRTHRFRTSMKNAGVLAGIGALGVFALVSNSFFHDAHAQQAAPSPAQPPTYKPSMSDLMIGTIQPRHVKLWLAGQNGNWDYAAYEIRDLKGAFIHFGRAYPKDKDIPLPDMIASVTDQPFSELDKAVTAKNTTAFNAAYGDLTTGCNACHQAVGHAAIVIRVPQQASFPDQDFGPAKP